MTAPSTSAKRFGIHALFLLPTLFLLASLVLYPALRTVYDSFFDRFGQDFVGIDNYAAMLRSGRIRRAILNSFLWVAILPVLVTGVGLVLAVLVDKIRWQTAFKLVVFIPLAIAVMSSGVMWRLVLETSPERGALNAVANVPIALNSPEGPYPGAAASTDDLLSRADGSVAVRITVGDAGAVANFGLLRVGTQAIPDPPVQAVSPEPTPDAVLGVVWRDTKPAPNTRGVIESGEFGLPGVTVELRALDGSEVASAVTGPDGGFAMAAVPLGTYEARIDSPTFRAPWQGVAWLDASLITPVAMMAALWVWAGFAVLVIGAGLAGINRSVLDAARLDGASEWRVFRRFTLPLLAPVLVVVFLTLAVNALKLFDLIVGLAPGSVQDDANVLAIEMWRTAFTGAGDRGLGSAIAVLLFLLVLPIMAANVRRLPLGPGRR
jgi:alpha-glucoside transport system permease protein